jgi:putative transcriptional regulator
MGKMFELLKEGLEDAIAYERGQANKARVKQVRVDTVEIPQHPKEYLADDIKSLRNKLNYSQGFFAVCLNVSLNTVQAWEQGVRRPSHSALRLLEIIDKGPKFLSSLTHSPRKRTSIR